MRLENVIVHVNLNLKAFGDHQEFILDFIADELGVSRDFYFKMLESYLKKHTIEGVNLLEDKTYYQSVYSFELDSFECYSCLESTLGRFLDIIERKYFIESFNTFYHRLHERKLKFKTGSERDYFQSRAFNLFVNKFIKF